MHFTQTRIATIDSFVVLFIIWSYVFMVAYIRMDYWHTKFWKTLIPLLLSGIFMGLSVASKWTGCYAGVGLGVLFFWSVFRRYREYRYAKTELSANPKHPQEKLLSCVLHQFPNRILITLGSCILFFIFIPLTIYYVSYIPYFLPTGGVTVKKVIQAAVGDYFETGIFGGMFGYHSTPGLGMDHPFYSPWYQWPLIVKPMWYYSSTYHATGVSETIAAFGNPAVWWCGLGGLIGIALLWLYRHVSAYQITLDTKRDDMRPAILLVAFAAQYLPWTLVPRGTYIYHYFPSVPFIILCTVLCFDVLLDKTKGGVTLPALHRKLLANIRKFYGMKQTDEQTQSITIRPSGLITAILILYLLLSLALFIAFFPYASGITASTKWLSAMQWFSGWLYY